MKYGIYYAYWEKQWGGDALPYIEKIKHLGFDILEVACGDFDKKQFSYFEALGDKAKENNIILTGGYGPIPLHNIASNDSEIVDNAFAFYEDIFPKMKAAGITSLGGALYSYWPIDYNKPMDKRADFIRSVSQMKKLADLADVYNITLCMEALNRFEGYLINTASEALEYVKSVEKNNVKLMLDTFHMNIEEDNMLDAIKLAGSYLGELHIGEANRRPPAIDGLDWEGIGKALKSINYQGNVVMEPFVRPGGKVGEDIKIWRKIVNDDSDASLDKMAKNSLTFVRNAFA